MRRSTVRVGVLTIALALVVAACSTARGESPPPGDVAGLFAVDGRELYLECHGSGSPTVVLQSGFGNAADIWSVGAERPPSVMAGVAGFTRVCAYDRPGATRVSTDDGQISETPLPGRSQQAPMPRTAADVVAELHALLAAAGVPGPYVLVGHSLGGPFTQLYSRTFPADVAGIVLVDPTPPALRDLIAPAQWDAFAAGVLHPPEPIPGYAMEAYDLTASMDQLRNAPAPPQVPATVLMAQDVDQVPPGDPSAEAVAAIGRVRPEAFTRLAADIPGAALVTVPDTSHYIQIQRPDAVIEAVRSVAGR
ncbi:alpha/beta fold hydrolase [Actinomycetospora flava]|uniref:Alpha/beta hydrolase n=1 Tax=Actinomycetospora flava TaxID=3129232 RepID=A0ABU8MC57_9PSEU